MKKTESHKHFWLGENKQHFPEYETIFKLSDPRAFIKFRVDLAMFATFEEFVCHIAEIQWIDGRPDKRTQDEVLIDAWNFLIIEDRILEQDMLDEEYDDDDDDEW